MKRVGFLGLGQMGAPMARRLAQAGFDLTVYDPSDKAVAALAAAGASTANSAAEAASGRDVVIACLPNQAVSRTVGLGAGGVRDASDFGVYVEMSTIGSALVEEIAEAMAKRNTGFLDAPVSGGPRGADAGTLTTMVAGSDADFTACEDVLQAIAGNVFRVGTRPGQGQVAKLCNNMISATAMAVSWWASPWRSR